MSSFRFSDSFGMFDSTPVENIFIEGYMPRAPGDYVKVYLYGLRQCYHADPQSGIDACARALGMEQDAVRDAFSYWEKQGVLRRVSDKPPVYQYNNLKAMLVHNASPEDENLYHLREFNNALQGIFGKRLLAPAEYQRAAEWIEELHLSEEAVLMLARNCAADRGAKVSFNYLDKVASTWAKAGISTKEAAEEYLRTQGNAYQGAQAILREMRKRRAPTVAEERLYQKWLMDWGFSHEAVKEALNELTKSGEPSFAYLDKVLQSARVRGETDAGSMAAQRGRRDEESADVRGILSALGAVGSATEDLRAMYSGFLKKGFDRDAILLAAKHARRRGGRSMQDVADALDRFAKRELYAGAEIDRYMIGLNRERDAAATIKALCGDDTPLEKGDLQAYRRMAGTGLSEQVLTLAAGYAKNAREPMSFAAKLAENWHAAGVRTEEDARREHDGHLSQGAKPQAAASPPSGKFKEVTGQKFQQRDYSDNEWAAFAMDIDALDGGDA